MAFRVRALQRGELDAFLACFQAAFRVDDSGIGVVRNSLINDPYFLPERIRVGLLDDQIVSHAVILHRAAYAGNSVVTVAGLTAVATHPYYQGRGFGGAVVQDAVRVARRRGYDLVMLTTGLADFFARFGFREVPKIDGHECPATALARLQVEANCTLQRLDYSKQWPELAGVYHRYSQGRTGMQVREMRFWESWPRRGTFPYGFSAQLDAIGLVALVQESPVAYLGAHCPSEHPHLSVSELAHLPGQQQAALALLRQAAQRFLTVGSGRAIIRLSGDAPVLKALAAQGVPLAVETGPGLMVLITGSAWLQSIGLRKTDEAIQHLFRSPTPIVWHRDGY